MKMSKAAAIEDDMKSDDDIYADKADKEVAEKRPRSLWYYCCDHGCIAEHQGLMSNGSLYNKPGCHCCKDKRQVHTFAT